MAVLVFVESADGLIKRTSLEAVAYGSALNGEVTAIALSQTDNEELENLGKFGASRVLYVDDERFNKGIIKPYSSVLANVISEIGADTLVLANTSLGAPVAARLAIKINASLASNVVELPDTSTGFKVKRSIYTGNAYSVINLTKEKKIISIKKNAAKIKITDSTAVVEKYYPNIEESDFDTTINSSDKATGDILLPEAEIVVSGGRGMKGPENWEILENLAKELGAALGCSKPVSDMEWRPHHEHVGQTGVKVSPNLYIAVGISGAIQHLAGVNSSKYIVVINKDPEAPFFKAADYGIIGDAFEVLPKLIEAIKAVK